MLNTPKLPIAVAPDIENAYVSVNDNDVIYNSFETYRTLSLTGTKLASSKMSLTAAATGSNSAYYQVAKMLLFNNSFIPSFTSLTAYSNLVGICALYKNNFDTDIRKGSLTVTTSGTIADTFYDSGSGELKRLSTNTTVGVVLNDYGMFVVTASDQWIIVQDITQIDYKATVIATTLNVYCKCHPNELNYSLNPTVFESSDVGDWMKESFTASTTACRFRTAFTSSGQSWQPTITHIGLYNDNNDLLAVAKMARPLNKPTDLPITVHLQVDL